MIEPLSGLTRRLARQKLDNDRSTDLVYHTPMTRRPKYHGPLWPGRPTKAPERKNDRYLVFLVIVMPALVGAAIGAFLVFG